MLDEIASKAMYEEVIDRGKRSKNTEWSKAHQKHT